MSSGAPILLIGEEALPSKIRRNERIHNRVLTWVPAQPATLADARELAAIYCSKVGFADDLLDYITQRSQGRVRRIVGQPRYDRARGVARPVEIADAAWWDRREIYTGEAPTRRVP